MSSLILGFGFIFFAAVAGGSFGLHYRVMKRYPVENAAWLSLFFATIVVPLIAIQFILPGWTSAISAVGGKTILLVYLLGFGWGMGAITYAYGFNILGMAFAMCLIMSLSIIIGAIVPLIRHWSEVTEASKLATIIGTTVVIVGTIVIGKAGIIRERDLSAKSEGGGEKEQKRTAVQKATGRLFLVGLAWCIVSGFLSPCANLGFEFASPLEEAMGEGLAWKATLVRWMPMYWGGISALTVFLGGSMLRKGTLKLYFAKGTLRDFAIASSMGIIHFLCQIPYGIGAYYLGKLGTSAGWSVLMSMILCVATAIGFMLGEWKEASKSAIRVLLSGMVLLIVALAILGYANTLT